MDQRAAGDPANEMTAGLDMKSTAAYGAPNKVDTGVEDVDIRVTWMVLANNWKLIAAIVSFTALVTVAVAIVTPPVFRAEVLLIPSAQERSGSAIFGELGELASLAGMRTSGSRATTSEALATLQSRVLTDAFIRDEGLKPVLFQEIWNQDKKMWRVDDREIPTAWDAFELFNTEVRSVTENKNTGIVTLAIEWKDPVMAATWANELVRRANRQLQQNAINEATQSIAYLKKALAQTNSLEVQQAIFRLIEGEMKSAAVAHAREEYAFRIIDPAVAPEKMVRPKRALLIALGIVAGLILGIVTAFLRAGITGQGFGSKML